jgi:hypothetical protein
LGNRKEVKWNDKLRGSLVKKQDSKEKMKKSAKNVPQDGEEKKATTPQGKNKSKLDTTIRFLAIRL